MCLAFFFNRGKLDEFERFTILIEVNYLGVFFFPKMS